MASERGSLSARSRLACTPWQPCMAYPLAPATPDPAPFFRPLQACQRERPQQGRSFLAFSSDICNPSMCEMNGDFGCSFCGCLGAPFTCSGRSHTQVCSGPNSALVAPPVPSVTHGAYLPLPTPLPSPPEAAGAAGCQPARRDRPLGWREGRGGPGAGCGLRFAKLHTHAGLRLAAWHRRPLGAESEPLVCVSLLCVRLPTTTLLH